MVADSDGEGQNQAGENEDPQDGLTANQERAIVALLNEQTIGKAAKAAGIGERTLYRWLGDPTFSSVYRRHRREAFGQAIALTQRYAPLAVNTLAQVMMDQTAPHHAKVSAATGLLKFGREGIELDDLAARVEALERARPPAQKSDRLGRWAAYK